MTTKTYAWTTATEATVTVHDGPAAGTYKVSAFSRPETRSGLRVLYLGLRDGRSVFARVEDLGDLVAEMEQRAAAAIASEPISCERCNKSLGTRGSNSAIMLPGSYMGTRTIDPYCNECVTLLRATSGHGEAALTGITDTDNTPANKGD